MALDNTEQHDIADIRCRTAEELSLVANKFFLPEQELIGEVFRIRLYS